MSEEKYSLGDMFLVIKNKQIKKNPGKTHNHPNHHGHLHSIKTDLGDKRIKEKFPFNNKTKNTMVIISMQSGKKGNRKIRMKSQTITEMICVTQKLILGITE